MLSIANGKNKEILKCAFSANGIILLKFINYQVYYLNGLAIAKMLCRLIINGNTALVLSDMGNCSVESMMIIQCI